MGLAGTLGWCYLETHHDQSHPLLLPYCQDHQIIGDSRTDLSPNCWGTQFNPTPKCPQSLTNHWYVGWTELLGTGGQMEFTNY